MLLFKQLTEFLEKQINQELSPKMKLSFESNARGYFQERERIEWKLISEVNWCSYFSEHVTTETEFEDPKILHDSDLLTFNQIMIQTLKRFVDARLEKEPMCDYVRAVYSDTKSELLKRFSDYPQGSGFEDYLSARTQREGKEDARKSGDYCIYCGSEKVRSNGSMWSCDSCGRSFRKH